MSEPMTPDDGPRRPWDEGIDAALLRRLLERVERPGVVSPAIVRRIFGWVDHFSRRLSLLDDLAKRHGNRGHLRMNAVPIVHARWVVAASEGAPGLTRAAAQAVTIELPVAKDLGAGGEPPRSGPEAPSLRVAEGGREAVGAPLVVERVVARGVPVQVALASSAAMVSGGAPSPRGAAARTGGRQHIEASVITKDSAGPIPVVKADFSNDYLAGAALPPPRGVHSRAEPPLREAVTSPFAVTAPLLSQPPMPLTRGANIETAAGHAAQSRGAEPTPTLPVVLANAPPSRAAQARASQLPGDAEPPPSLSRVLPRAPAPRAPSTELSHALAAPAAGARDAARRDLPTPALDVRTADVRAAPGMSAGVAAGAEPAREPPSNAVTSAAPIDVDALVEKVQRKLLRRIASERERRGGIG